MKLLNKLLLISSTSTIVLPSLLVVACNRVTENSISNLSIEQVDDFINSIKSEDDLKKVAEFEFEVVFGRKKSLSETLPTEIEASASSLKIKLREKKYKDNVTISVESARTNRTATANTSNIEGKVTLFISILNRKNNKSQARQLVLSGLSRNAGFDHNSRQEVDPLAAFGGPEGVKKYSENNQKQRFKSDNDTYIKRLESMYNPDGADKAVDIKQRFGLDISQDDQAKFDKLAEEVNFDSYYNAALKGFTLPVYENDNSKMVKKLRINDNPEVNKGPSFTDSLGTDHSKSNGLARTLINETYKTIAEQTFQVKFTYVKDFANEIGLLEKHKALISSWDESKVEDFKNDQIGKLEYQYKIEIEQIERQIKSLFENDEGIKSTRQKEIEEKRLELDKKRKEIEKHNRESLIKLQEKEIQELQKRRNEGKELGSESGTMWIMDYQLDSSDPVKFYFGTNSHVAKALTSKLTAISITRIKDSVEVGQKLMLNSFDPNFETFTFEINEKNKDSISAIFHATDFVNSKPSDYLVKEQADKYKDAGFYADFAVIEFDFEKLLSNKNFHVMSAKKPKDDYKNYEAKKLAKILTNDYSKKEGKQIKFKSDSYLTNYAKIDRPIIIENSDQLDNLENIYVLGYPTSENDYYLDQHEDANQIRDKKTDFSLWINADSKYYGAIIKQEGSSGSYKQNDLLRGNFLSYQIGYRSFIDKPGLTDAFLAAHRVGNDLYTLTQNGQTKQYFNFGLELMPRFYAPAGGASGSSVRNKNNELIAVYHASNNSAKTGLATMFRSPGYNYNDLFGSYNLPQYDLIYGNGKNQKNSYRHEMLKKYNGKLKTKLFKDGFNEKDIPKEFKFPEKSK